MPPQRMTLGARRSARPLVVVARVLRRLSRRVHGVRRFLGVGVHREIIDVTTSSQGQFLGRVVLIAPGIMPVPSTGWGAVETVVHEQAAALAACGFEVKILNSPAAIDWLRVFVFWRPDTAVLHYDEWARRARVFASLVKSAMLACSHYAYMGQPSLWPNAYRRSFRWMAKADVLLVLSDQIREAVMPELSEATTVVCIPNGSDSVFECRTPDREAVILGKVEPRKHQLEVLLNLQHSGIQIDCVGPNVDARFSSADHKHLVGYLRGEWTREQLCSQLGRYRVLILASEAEADALVLYEAQLAGLSLVVTRSAVGAQDCSLPWLYVLDDLEPQELRSVVRKAIAENANMREDIRSWATQQYRWSQRIFPLIAVIRGTQTSASRGDNDPSINFLD